jgi:hypothetical protein
VREHAQQPDLARELAEARAQIAELEAQMAALQGLAPTDGVPPVLVHALANAPDDGQVVRLGDGVIAVAAPGGDPAEVAEAITAAATHPVSRVGGEGAPGAVRIFARRLPAGLRALSVPSGDGGRDLVLSAALPRAERRQVLRMVLRASRRRPVMLAAAVAAARFAGRAVSVSRAHAGHAATAAAITAAAAVGAAFVLLPATSPAPAGQLPPRPGTAAHARHHGRAARYRQPAATGPRRRQRGVVAGEPGPSPQPSADPAPSGLVPSLVTSPTGLVRSLLSSPPVRVSASPSSSGSGGDVCVGVLVLGVCVPI